MISKTCDEYVARLLNEGIIDKISVNLNYYGDHVIKVYSRKHPQIEGTYVLTERDIRSSNSRNPIQLFLENLLEGTKESRFNLGDL